MKKGVSLVSLIVVIVIMGILAGIVVITGIDSSKNITIETYAIELLDIQNGVDEYYYRYNKYPSGNEYILDITKVSSKEQFEAETVVQNGINFKIVDLSLIGIKSTKFGKGEGKDIYVLSEKTGIVYYLEGVIYESKVYYTFTDELYDITNPNSSELVSTQDIKIYNVIFSPSTTEYTNSPVTVEVKIPKIAVINSVITTNNKSVGEETVEGLYKKIQINETSSDKTGNYKITVNYTYRGVQKTAEYEVTNYDANLPTITYTEEINGDLKTVRVNVDGNNSKIKMIKYEEEIISKTDYFENYGKNITNNKFIVSKDSNFTIYVETESGTNLMVNNMPETWRTNVVDIVDGVPIPKGFTASPYGVNGDIKAENTKAGGLVIYELKDGETAIPSTETQFISWTTRNQYVWVPVENFETEFVRKDYISTTSKVVNKSGTYNSLGVSNAYWEAMVDSKNLPLTTIVEQSQTYMSTETLAEVQAMYASVKEYGGFYIARYEAGVDDVNWRTSDGTAIVKTLVNVHSKMNKIPYNYVQWSSAAAMNVDTGGVVEVARSLYTSNTSDISYNKYGVISILTYGVQWDKAVQWFVDTGAVEENEVNTTIGSTKYGNYKDHDITSYTELNSGSRYTIGGTNAFAEVTSGYTKGSNTTDVLHELTTGALKTAKINNIYDMAGNVYELTMEGYNTNARACRGGGYNLFGTAMPLGERAQINPNGSDATVGFRVSLYIKK